SQSRSRPPRGRHPFPTRRSSDLGGAGDARVVAVSRAADTRLAGLALPGDAPVLRAALSGVPVATEGAEDIFGSALPDRRRRCPRSEEHTSELQSRSDLVCRLLLE